MPHHPLNVLRVITWLPVGGIERRLVAVLPRLDPVRFRVRLVCVRERGPLADELEQRGVPVDVCPLRSRLSPVGIRALAALMRHHQIDIVHSHMYRSNVPATIAARLAGVPVNIAQVHNVDTWETRRQLWMDRFLSRWRDAVVCVSERVRHDVIARLRLSPDRAHVIYNGVEIERFADRSLREPTRRALGLAPDDVAVVFHHRLVAQKNPGMVVRIAEALGRTRPRLKVLVAGDGALRGELEAAGRESVAAGRLLFLGRRDDIPAILQASDLAILPSVKEGFSNAVIEALAAGLPVVATDVGGNAEAIQDGLTGRIVPPRDDDAFLDGVAGLLDDPERRRVMGDHASRRACDFSLDHMIKHVQNLYEDLARRKGLSL